MRRKSIKFIVSSFLGLTAALRDDQNRDPLTAQVCLALEPNIPLNIMGITDVNDLYDLCTQRFCLWTDTQKDLAALEINLLIQTQGTITTDGISNNGHDAAQGGTLIYGGFSVADTDTLADEPCTETTVDPDTDVIVCRRLFHYGETIESVNNF